MVAVTGRDIRAEGEPFRAIAASQHADDRPRGSNLILAKEVKHERNYGPSAKEVLRIRIRRAEVVSDAPVKLEIE
jgi:hypothetical protein